MLDKKNRLTKKGSFDYIYRKGESRPDKAIVLVYVRSKSGVRVGFSVSNKIGKATIRNKIKRRLRSAFRKHISDVLPCQLVFVAKNPLIDFSYLQIEQLMRKLLSKAGLLRS